jgi:hypothetical protein
MIEESGRRRQAALTPNELQQGQEEEESVSLIGSERRILEVFLL